MGRKGTQLVFGGLATIDLVHLADELPTIGQKATAEASYVDVGGPAANAAITAAILGSETALHTVLGVGLMSEFARGVLQNHAVAVVDHDPAVDIPIASIWVDGSGNRTILSTDNTRSSVRARAEWIDFDGVAGVLLDGHYPDLQLTIGKAAAEAGVPVVLDCGRWRPIYAKLLPLASDVIMTAGFRPPEMVGVSAEETVAVTYGEYRPNLCAMSRGPGSILLADDAGFTELEVPQVDAIDTMGAGDVLHGAYLHYRYGELMEGRAALSRAGRVASYSCRFQGARVVTDSE